MGKDNLEGEVEQNTPKFSQTQQKHSAGANAFMFLAKAAAVVYIGAHLMGDIKKAPDYYSAFMTRNVEYAQDAMKSPITERDVVIDGEKYHEYTNTEKGEVKYMASNFNMYPLAAFTNGPEPGHPKATDIGVSAIVEERTCNMGDKHLYSIALVTTPDNQFKISDGTVKTMYIEQRFGKAGDYITHIPENVEKTAVDMKEKITEFGQDISEKFKEETTDK